VTDFNTVVNDLGSVADHHSIRYFTAFVISFCLAVFDVFDPDDEALDLTVSGADKSPTARYAESVGWELPKTEK
jgi:hypothetical protein